MKNRLKQIRIRLGLQQGEMAERIEIHQQQLSKYERGENKPTSEFLIKLCEKLDVNINWLLASKGEMFTNKNILTESDFINDSGASNPDMIEISYWNEISGVAAKLKNPLVKSVWFDREIVSDIWKKKPDNLKIISMPGDKMAGGDYPLRTSDILLIDTSLTDISLTGIYFFTTNDKNPFVNVINVLYDDNVQMNFYNSSYPTRIVTPEQLQGANFRVWGRMIKNLSLTK